MLTALLALQLVTYDIKPTLVLTGGLIADGVTTKYCIDSNPNAIESNSRYTTNGRDINYNKMWSEKALLIGSYTAIALLAKHYSNKQPSAEMNNSRKMIHFFGYAVGGSVGFIAARNINRCK